MNLVTVLPCLLVYGMLRSYARKSNGTTTDPQHPRIYVQRCNVGKPNLNCFELVHADWAIVREIETELFGQDNRTFLGYVLTAHISQCMVEHVRHCVVGCDLGAPLPINTALHRVPYSHLPA